MQKGKGNLLLSASSTATCSTQLDQNTVTLTTDFHPSNNAHPLISLQSSPGHQPTPAFRLDTPFDADISRLPRRLDASGLQLVSRSVSQLNVNRTHCIKLIHNAENTLDLVSHSNLGLTCIIFSSNVYSFSTRKFPYGCFLICTNVRVFECFLLLKVFAHFNGT